MIGRGEHSEIVAFVGRTVDSELSGNMIDLCPVGALTSKPFRYAARTWELSRRKSVSPHDALGSNLVVQVKADRVLRVLPLENDAVNECWISDKDRFSYEALDGDDRLTSPLVRDGDGFRAVDWPTALEFVARGLRETIAKHGGAALGTLVSPHPTLEEMALAARLTRALGSDNVDFRLRQSDFRGDGRGAGVPWLGMPVAATRWPRPRAGRGLAPAQGPSAARAAPAAGGEEGRAGVVPEPGGRRAAAQGPALAGRGAVADAAGAGRDRRRGRPGRRPAGAAGAELDRAARDGRGDRGEPRRREGGGGPARQPRRAARRRLAAARARAGARPPHRRVAGLPRRGGQQRGRPSCRRAAAVRRARRGADAHRAAPRLPRRRRRARARLRESGRRARGARRGRLRRRAVGVPSRAFVRRRAAADRAVHGDRRHLRQLRRPGAVVQRRRQARRRCAAGMEGPARARLDARAARVRHCSLPGPRCWGGWCTSSTPS